MYTLGFKELCLIMVANRTLARYVAPRRVKSPHRMATRERVKSHPGM